MTNVLLDAAAEAWRSSVYDQYTALLERYDDKDGDPEKHVIRFNCKHHSPDHNPPTCTRDRSRSCDHDGTRNLIVSARACDIRRGVANPTYDDFSASDS